MAGPINVSAIAQAATRVAPRAANTSEQASAIGSARPRIVIVGIGRTPPKTTQSIIEQAAKRGLVPGEDIIATRYADLRVGKHRGFVRLAAGTGADGMVVAGQGRESLFLYRGGGNLKESHLRKIAMIEAVDGATSLTDSSAIRRLGSKAITNDVLADAGLSLAETIPVRGADEAVRAFDSITGRFGAETAVLKKVNSLGGKDVHFVRSHDEIRAVIAKDPDSGFVMQEYLAAAKDQDVRVHGVWNHATDAYELPNSYVRNRNAFQLTPNLANGGFPTNYHLSPWEQDQVERAMTALAKGSAQPPLHVGLDLFPRRTITASTVEANAALQDAVRSGNITRADAIARSADTAVIGEAATSAGTKGTELVLGEGINPVTSQIVDGMMHLRRGGAANAIDDAARGASNLGRSS